MTQPPATFEDNTLIKMALDGKADCFAVLMDRHLYAVRRRIAPMVSNATDADDLVQEVLFKVWRRLSTFRFEASFRTWITRIAINEALHAYRRQKYHSRCQARENLDELASAFESPHQSLTRVETSRTVHRALAGLPEKYRQVLILREFDQLSIREMAKSLDASLPAVESRLFRARVLLSSSLKRSNRQAPAAKAGR
jgi:RNA polymerase sigma-70 factor (ECF subfamily)